MAWDFGYREKLNPAQPDIAIAEGDQISREPIISYRQYYETLEVVNRAINMLVDDISEIPIAVGENLGIQNGINQGTPANVTNIGIRLKTLIKLLNKQPNPYQDINSFRRNMYMDYIIDGNIFLHFDGQWLYHLPACNVKIVPDEKTYIKEYSYLDNQHFPPNEIIHIKENSFFSIYRGVSRLRACASTMAALTKMRKFQHNFFDNGAIPGLVIKSPNTLSEKIKERMLQTWVTRYRPDAGGRRPIILDGGLELDPISNVSFKELDFETSVTKLEEIVLKGIGVPPILLDSGNNANIRPNHRVYYLETVLPILRKTMFAFERYFGYNLTEDVTNIPALQPELSDQADYYTSLVNGGILTSNEARIKLGYEKMEGQDDIRVPQNIAGSAVNPSIGGKPAASSGDK